MEFDIPKEKNSIIKVIGVGGGGSNAVNHMYQQGIKGVDFLICNTDAQALEISPVPTKIQLGPSLTDGRGAGSLPEVGKNAAIENIEDIKSALSNQTKMVFITAGMGGGTGTGAAPIIAGVAKEMGILTVGIITIPFAFEGKKRKSQASIGIEELKRNVDTLLIICNDKLREMHGDLKLTEAFGRADDILTIAAKSIAEIITVTGYINVDFADVQTVLKNSGVAIMGRAMAQGERRALNAAENALESPLLNDSNIQGARHVLLSITSGSHEVTMDEIGEITEFMQEQAGQSAEIIFGTGFDAELGDKVCVTVIATGFTPNEELGNTTISSKVIRTLDEIVKVEPQNPLSQHVIQEDTFLVEEKNNEISAPKLEIITPIEEKEELNITIKTIDTVEINEEKLTVVEPEQMQSENNFESQFATGIDQFSDEDDNHMSLTESTEDALFIVSTATDENQNGTESNNEDIFRRSKERIQKLRDMSYKNQVLQNNPSAIFDLEKEPAYKRRNIQLQAVPDSGKSQMSHYSLAENGEKKVEITQNNTFIHDKPD